MCSGLLYSQDDKVSLLIAGFGSLPQGDYGKSLGEDAKPTRRFGFDFGEHVGLAKPGVGLGGELNTQLLTDGLGWIVSVRYLLNSTDPSAVQREFNHQMGDSMNVIAETGTWHHIPVLTGFRYSLNVTQKLAVTAMIQGGINISQAPSRKVIVDGIIAEETSLKTARDFGYEFGIGLEWADKWNLEVSYADFGVPRYEGTRKLSEIVLPGIAARTNAVLGEERSISMILVRLGYYIF